MSRTIADVAFWYPLYFSLLTISQSYGQETQKEVDPSMQPSFGFSSVAVVRFDKNNDLDVLLPTLTPKEVVRKEQYTVEVPYTETVDGITKQFVRDESRERDVTVVENSEDFKMVRTKIAKDSIRLTDLSGNTRSRILG